MTRKMQIKNEIWSAITHGIGIILSILGMILLILKGIDTNSITLFSYIVYTCSLVLLYLFSTLFHCLYFTKAKRVFQIFDHCSIFLLIAGTYTPYCMLAIKGVKGLILMIMIWLMSILGILYHILASKKKQVFETIIFVVMGWLCILGAKELFLSLGKIGLGLLVAGGIIFTLGALVYSIPKIKYAHVFWHIFVMLGSILMFISIYCYI